MQIYREEIRMSEIKIADLKEYLSGLKDENLRKEVLDLFRQFPNVKEYYSVKLNKENGSEVLEKYKKIIENEFFPVRGHGKLRYSIMKKALTDFKRVSRDIKGIAELMVTYVENGTKFTKTYGDIDEKFYYNMLNMYQQSSDYVRQNNLEETYRGRLKKIMEDGQNIGYGYSDELVQIYYSIFDDEEDE